MTWEEFSSKVQTHQIGFMGEPNEIMPGWGEFHENPAACICDASDANAKEGSPQTQIHDGQKSDTEDNTNKDSGYLTYEQATEDEQNVSETDYLDNGSASEEKGQLNGKDSVEPNVILKADQSELEELFSD